MPSHHELGVQTVENAVELVAGLPDLSRGDDVERLEQQRQRMPPPEGPQVAEAVDQLRESLADIEAIHNAGRGPSESTIDLDLDDVTAWLATHRVK